MAIQYYTALMVSRIAFLFFIGPVMNVSGFELDSKMGEWGESNIIPHHAFQSPSVTASSSDISSQNHAHSQPDNNSTNRPINDSKSITTIRGTTPNQSQQRDDKLSFHVSSNEDVSGNGTVVPHSSFVTLAPPSSLNHKAGSDLDRFEPPYHYSLQPHHSGFGSFNSPGMGNNAPIRATGDDRPNMQSSAHSTIAPQPQPQPYDAYEYPSTSHLFKGGPRRRRTDRILLAKELPWYRTMCSRFPCCTFLAKSAYTSFDDDEGGGNDASTGTVSSAHSRSRAYTYDDFPSIDTSSHEFSFPYHMTSTTMPSRYFGTPSDSVLSRLAGALTSLFHCVTCHLFPSSHRYHQITSHLPTSSYTPGGLMCNQSYDPDLTPHMNHGCCAKAIRSCGRQVLPCCSPSVIEHIANWASTLLLLVIVISSVIGLVVLRSRALVDLPLYGDTITSDLCWAGYETYPLHYSAEVKPTTKIPTTESAFTQTFLFHDMNIFTTYRPTSMYCYIPQPIVSSTDVQAYYDHFTLEGDASSTDAQTQSGYQHEQPLPGVSDGSTPTSSMVFDNRKTPIAIPPSRANQTIPPAHTTEPIQLAQAVVKPAYPFLENHICSPSVGWMSLHHGYYSSYPRGHFYTRNDHHQTQLWYKVRHYQKKSSQTQNALFDSERVQPRSIGAQFTPQAVPTHAQDRDAPTFVPLHGPRNYNYILPDLTAPRLDLFETYIAPHALDLTLNIPSTCVSIKRSFSPTIFRNPRRIFVHIDVSYQPPTIPYLQQVLSSLARAGTTHILLEFGPMFPYHDTLQNIRHRSLSYSEKQIHQLLSHITQLGLKVIPLLNTVSHLKWVFYAGPGHHPTPFHALLETPIQPDIPELSQRSFTLITSIMNQLVTPFLEYPSSFDGVHIGGRPFSLLECPTCTQQGTSVGALSRAMLSAYCGYILDLHKSQSPEFTSKPLRCYVWDSIFRHHPLEDLHEAGDPLLNARTSIILLQTTSLLNAEHPAYSSLAKDGPRASSSTGGMPFYTPSTPGKSPDLADTQGELLLLKNYVWNRYKRSVDGELIGGLAYSTPDYLLDNASEVIDSTHGGQQSWFSFTTVLSSTGWLATSDIDKRLYRHTNSLFTPLPSTMIPEHDPSYRFMGFDAQGPPGAATSAPSLWDSFFSDHHSSTEPSQESHHHDEVNYYKLPLLINQVEADGAEPRSKVHSLSVETHEFQNDRTAAPPIGNHDDFRSSQTISTHGLLRLMQTIRIHASVALEWIAVVYSNWMSQGVDDNTPMAHPPPPSPPLHPSHLNIQSSTPPTGEPESDPVNPLPRSAPDVCEHARDCFIPVSTFDHFQELLLSRVSNALHWSKLTLQMGLTSIVLASLVDDTPFDRPFSIASSVPTSKARKRFIRSSRLQTSPMNEFYTPRDTYMDYQYDKSNRRTLAFSPQMRESHQSLPSSLPILSLNLYALQHHTLLTSHVHAILTSSRLFTTSSSLQFPLFLLVLNVYAHSLFDAGFTLKSLQSGTHTETSCPQNSTTVRYADNPPPTKFGISPAFPLTFCSNLLLGFDLQPLNTPGESTSQYEPQPRPAMHTQHDSSENEDNLYDYYDPPPMAEPRDNILTALPFLIDLQFNRTTSPKISDDHRLHSAKMDHILEQDPYLTTMAFGSPVLSNEIVSHVIVPIIHTTTLRGVGIDDDSRGLSLLLVQFFRESAMDTLIQDFEVHQQEALRNADPRPLLGICRLLCHVSSVCVCNYGQSLPMLWFRLVDMVSEQNNYLFHPLSQLSQQFPELHSLFNSSQFQASKDLPNFIRAGPHLTLRHLLASHLHFLSSFLTDFFPIEVYHHYIYDRLHTYISPPYG